jgi:alkylation response protein AidB-like acyl-CoA dehydrogenase
MFHSTIEELPEWLRKAPRHCADPVAAARALRPLIEAHADEGARQGFVPEAVVRAIADSGLWGLMLTRELGGNEADARTLIDVTEELSYADGSTGWIYMATIFAMANAAVWLGPSAVDAIFNSDKGYVCAGQISKLGKAERVEGGYKVSGTFQFGSGSLYSSWLLGAFTVEKDGKPDLGPDGRPQAIYAFGPRRNIRFRGNWDVMGLVATASVDFEFIEQIIPDDFVMNLPGRVRRGGPVYEVGVSLGHVAWAVGVAQRALDEIKAIATRKRRFARSPLIDQPLFQRDYGMNVAAVEAARAAVYKVFDDWYRAAQAGKPGLEVKAHARLVSCWATDIAAKAGEFAYRAAGSDGLRNAGGTNKLQRCFRDLYAGTQHRHVDNNVLIEASTALLGIAPPGLEL